MWPTDDYTPASIRYTLAAEGSGPVFTSLGLLSFEITPVNDSGVIDWTATDALTTQFESGLQSFADTIANIDGVNLVRIYKENRGVITQEIQD